MIKKLKKKSTIPLDETGDTKSVENPEIQQTTQPEDSPQQLSNPSEEVPPGAIPMSGHPDSFSTHQPENLKQVVQTYQMTVNLTEDTYKAFNELYANRILQGRKTEKSEMICEAIQCLIKSEEEGTK